MFIGLLFNTESCINHVNIDMGFVCFAQLGYVHIFVEFHYAITFQIIFQWWLCPKNFCLIFLVYNLSEWEL